MPEDGAATSLLSKTRTWAEMIKLSHSVFALPFAVLAAFLAGRHLAGARPGWGHLLLVLVCMVAARSVAMTFNRIIDARIDAANPRTANRAIPAGRISPRQAWAFFSACAVLFVIACAGFLLAYGNPWPVTLAVPLLGYLCGYSFAKRFTRWSHFYLGSAIALSPAAAWLAVDPQSLGWEAVVLAAAVTLWIGGFDIIYACQDLDFDRATGLFSLPARSGPGVALWIARGAHACTVVLLAILGILSALGPLYWSGVAAVGLLLLVENAMVRPNDFSKVDVAFFTMNGVISVVLGIVGVSDVLLGLEPLVRWGS